jgi:hypothetical protein
MRNYLISRTPELWKKKMMWQEVSWLPYSPTGGVCLQLSPQSVNYSSQQRMSTIKLTPVQFNRGYEKSVRGI